MNRLKSTLQHFSGGPTSRVSTAKAIVVILGALALFFCIPFIPMFGLRLMGFELAITWKSYLGTAIMMGFGLWWNGLGRKD